MRKRPLTLRSATERSKRGRATVGGIGRFRDGKPSPAQEKYIEETERVRKWRDEEIWRLREAGVPVSHIAKEAGLDRCHIYTILRTLKSEKEANAEANFAEQQELFE